MRLGWWGTSVSCENRFILLISVATVCFGLVPKVHSLKYKKSVFIMFNIYFKTYTDVHENAASKMYVLSSYKKSAVCRKHVQLIQSFKKSILHGQSMFADKVKIYGVTYNQSSSIAFDETSSYSHNFSAFHWSSHGSLVSIGQNFVTTKIVHLPKRGMVGWCEGAV